jgi:hypothetical protein
LQSLIIIIALAAVVVVVLRTALPIIIIIIIRPIITSLPHPACISSDKNTKVLNTLMEQTKFQQLYI